MLNKEFRLHFAIDLFACNQNNVIENQVINDCHKLINNKVLSDLYSLSTIRSFMRTKAYYLFVRKYLRSRLPTIWLSHSNQCSVDDTESDVFEELLTFIYTGKLPKAQSMT
jgi:hypothetical protein